MKRLFFMVVVALGMCATTFAGNKNEVKGWNFDVNSNSLCKFLRASSDQNVEIANISDKFVYDVQKAESTEKDLQIKKLRTAVYENLRQMRETLSSDQYRRYLCIVNVTLRNKGLDTLMEDYASK